MATFFSTSNFPNLSDYAPEEGLFQEYRKDYIQRCIDAFNGRVPGQPSYFISARHWQQILNPRTQDSELNEDLYAVVFCYAMPQQEQIRKKSGVLRTGSHAYLRIRLIFAKPETDQQTIPANVCTSLVGKTTKFPSRVSSDFEWISDARAIRSIDQDVKQWSHPARNAIFPRLEPLIRDPNNKEIVIYEGNIIGKKRLEEIYNTFVVGEGNKGINIRFAYDNLLKKLFLVFSINPDWITLGPAGEEPLGCPPNPTNICRPSFE